MSDWRPIETAPKDTSLVLLLCDWEPLIVVGYYGPATDKSVADYDQRTWRVAWDQEAFEAGYEATHWQPLPASRAP